MGHRIVQPQASRGFRCLDTSTWEDSHTPAAHLPAALAVPWVHVMALLWQVATLQQNFLLWKQLAWKGNISCTLKLILLEAASKGSNSRVMDLH